jgi:hypothetical protein
VDPHRTGTDQADVLGLGEDGHKAPIDITHRFPPLGSALGVPTQTFEGPQGSRGPGAAT